MIKGGVGQKRTLILMNLEKVTQHTTNDTIPTIYAARVPNLGLTAYGDTSEEAENNLQVTLNTYVNKLYHSGILGKRLAGLGIRWYWEDTSGLGHCA